MLAMWPCDPYRLMQHPYSLYTAPGVMHVVASDIWGSNMEKRKVAVCKSISLSGRVETNGSFPLTSSNGWTAAVCSLGPPLLTGVHQHVVCVSVYVHYIALYRAAEQLAGSSGTNWELGTVAAATQTHKWPTRVLLCTVVDGKSTGGENPISAMSQLYKLRQP